MGFESKFNETLQFDSSKDELLEFSSNPFATSVQITSAFDRIMSFDSEWVTEEV